MHEKYSIAYRLWIYYHTITEKHDRNLNFIRPSIHEEGIVIPYGASYRESLNFASKKKKLIYEIAKSLRVETEIMENEKCGVNRMKQNTLNWNMTDFIKN